jgi:membrane fusion protein, heavy metal efflux system
MRTTSMPNTRCLLVVVIAGAYLLGVIGCKGGENNAAAAAKSAAANPLKVQVSADLRDQITVGKPVWEDVTTQEKVAARVETDVSRVARIGSPVDGRITKMLVYEGQKVKQGEVMAMLHSNALSDTQFSFLKAFSQEHLAEQSAERARQLVQSDVIGTAELQKREAEVLQTGAEVAALRAQLRGLGMSDQAIQQLEETKKLNSDYPIIASISGTVIERTVTIGQVVQPADPAFLLADLSNLWFVADVPEEQARSLYLGKNVIATIPALGDEKITGKLTFVSPVVNPQTRTVQARMNLPNAEGLFKPEMLASMIFESRPEKGLTIPTTAVVREENTDHVFVQTSATEFILREVELGDEVSDRRVVENGISANETIILDGAFHLNNKRHQDQIKGAE